MSFERLIEEVHARNQAALDAEQRGQDDERARILEERDRRIRAIRDEVGRQSAIDTRRERVQRVASAKLDARKRLFEAREHRAAEEIEAVRSLVGEFAQSPRYSEVLDRMYALALGELGRSIRVAGRGEDAALLRALAGKGFDPSPLAILGGLVATASDGSRRLNLSFDELLRLRENRVRELLRD